MLPLVGFDASGNRMGMGGGYYDRTFSFKSLKKGLRGPTLIGLAHEIQRVEELPVESWDIPLTAIVTDQKSYP
jgi:5-formyltetrahydrofolate cyclo-ligase